ncbi:coniferyl aldehyde dehydrogenase [Litorilituus lipolyticus]|uniref:Aldehyde dehydrogenase n=1 Tax=Litorilituus lipolyticus TaxID=2491017 RepID=A0A502L6Z1_9GAMM|nr:coniferyl aldehyde dehydrogenase [Litorilituus lipolyticus]TPH18121.1 coniferyl aldehyde dehydrogenase [Litorilituus lipolyticus]
MNIENSHIEEYTSIEQLQDIFASQRAAFNNNIYPKITERIAQLKQLKAAVMNNQEALISAISSDFGHRCADETRISELLTFVEAIDTSIKHIHRWTKPSTRKVSIIFQPASNQVLYQPLGVVGIMVPWNYPLILSLGPLVTALTAGNRVMLKLSEYTPHFNECLTTLLATVFKTDQVAVTTGVADVSTAFSQLPFNHLFFTGSTGVGKLVMKAAAENLTPVTLELGGKSPAIITDNVDMDLAAERICFGKSLNAGQICVAPDYILCPEHKKHEFIEAYKNAFARMYPSIKDNPDYSTIINEAQYLRLQKLIEEAELAGARCTQINPANESFENTRKMPPTIVENASADLGVLTEELFGPILPIVTYNKLEQAIDYVNDRARPLALYLFSLDKGEQAQVSYQTHSGGICINNTITHLAQGDLPFGGVGDSGMGHYHGFEGFQTFSKAKAVHKIGKLNGGKLLYPPYGKSIHQLFYKLFVR